MPRPETAVIIRYKGQQWVSRRPPIIYINLRFDSFIGPAFNTYPLINGSVCRRPFSSSFVRRFSEPSNYRYTIDSRAHFGRFYGHSRSLNSSRKPPSRTLYWTPCLALRSILRRTISDRGLDYGPSPKHSRPWIPPCRRHGTHGDVRSFGRDNAKLLD